MVCISLQLSEGLHEFNLSNESFFTLLPPFSLSLSASGSRPGHVSQSSSRRRPLDQSERVSERDGSLLPERQSPHGGPLAGAAGAGTSSLIHDGPLVCARTSHWCNKKEITRYRLNLPDLESLHEKEVFQNIPVYITQAWVAHVCRCVFRRTKCYWS